MNVLILGGAGRMGPWVVHALEGRHRLRVTDVPPAPEWLSHEYRQLDIADPDGVMAAAEGMDAIINLAVMRNDRRAAFDVNTLGNHNLATAAVRHDIRRIVNTGPHYQLAGPQYEGWDFGLQPDMPPAPGARLYPLTKALGQEVLRVFSERHDLYVQTLLFCTLRMPDSLELLPNPPHMHDAAPANPPRPVGADRSQPVPQPQRRAEPQEAQAMGPFSIAWPDVGPAVLAALEVELARLPSRCETYFVLADTPQGKFRNDKIRRILDWTPRFHLEPLWIRKP